jgi:hypothetical protein
MDTAFTVLLQKQVIIPVKILPVSWISISAFWDVKNVKGNGRKCERNKKEGGMSVKNGSALKGT